MKKKGTNYLLLHFLFFASGFSALIYQVAWQRSLHTALGGSIESVTIVVTVFMLGLGFGSLAGGYLSRLLPGRIIQLFSGIEAATGLYGLGSIALIGYAAWLGSANHTMIALYSMGVLFVPTLLMGASLPLLTALVNRQHEDAGISVAALYFFNTLGAAAASFATVLFFFEFMGLQGTVCAASAGNLLVGATALAAYGRRR
jgi:spermidine synthase